MRVLFIILYFIIGALLLPINTNATIMYFSVLPIQYWFFKVHYKRNDFVLTCLFAIFLISIGLGSVTFFLNTDNYQPTGYSAIGQYDFNLRGYYSAYYKVLIFMTVVHIVSQKRISHKTDVFEYFKVFFYKVSLRLPKKKYNAYLLFTVILFCLISIWMFNNSIGMTGIQPRKLPFHLSGILYHLRGKVFPLVLFFLYLKSSNKTYAFIVVAIFAIIGGFTACSKGLTFLILAPAIYESFSTGHRLRALVGVVVAAMLYVLVSFSRDLLFMFEQVSDNLLTVIDYSIDSLSTLDKRWLWLFVDSFCSRLYGVFSIVLADQYHLTSFSDILKYYMGTPIEDIIPDYVQTVFGFSLPEDRAFGVGIGYLGTMMLLASGNLLYIVLQGLFIGLLLSSLENILQNNIIRYNSPLVSIFSILISALCVLKLVEASGFIIVYVCIISIYFIPKLLKIASSKFVQQRSIY